MSCYILNFKHYHYENGFIVIPLLKSEVIFKEKSASLRRARNVFGSLLEVNKMLSKELRESTRDAHIPGLVKFRKENHYQLSIDSP